MVRVNDEVAAVLQEYADLMAITGGDAFRVRTYEKAARSVGGYQDDISQLDEKGLRQIPNVGASIAAKIEEYQRTRVIHQLEELRAATAQRGWLTPDDVINAWPLDQLQEFLHKKRSAIPLR